MSFPVPVSEEHMWPEVPFTPLSHTSKPAGRMAAEETASSATSCVPNATRVAVTLPLACKHSRVPDSDWSKS